MWNRHFSEVFEQKKKLGFNYEKDLKIISQNIAIGGKIFDLYGRKIILIRSLNYFFINNNILKELVIFFDRPSFK